MIINQLIKNSILGISLLLSLHASAQVSLAFCNRTGTFGEGLGEAARESAIEDCRRNGGTNCDEIWFDLEGGEILAVYPIKDGDWYRPGMIRVDSLHNGQDSALNYIKARRQKVPAKKRSVQILEVPAQKAAEKNWLASFFYNPKDEINLPEVWMGMDRFHEDSEGIQVEGIFLLSDSLNQNNGVRMLNYHVRNLNGSQFLINYYADMGHQQVSYTRNQEYPSLYLGWEAVTESKFRFRIRLEKPLLGQGPKISFGNENLKPFSKKGNDSITILPSSYDRYEISGTVTDESQIQSFSINGKTFELDKQGAWSVRIDEKLHGKPLIFSAVDVHGHRTEFAKTIMLYEGNEPDILIYDYEDRQYESPGYRTLVEIPKTAGIFLLRGKVLDENRVQKLTLDGNLIPVKPDGTFETQLLISQNQRKLKIEGTDIFGNTGELNFAVKFMEQHRDLALLHEEKFNAYNEKWQEENSERLSIALKNGKYFVHKKYVQDTARQNELGGESGGYYSRQRYSGYNSRKEEKLDSAWIPFPYEEDFNKDFSLRFEFEKLEQEGKVHWVFGYLDSLNYHYVEGKGSYLKAYQVLQGKHIELGSTQLDYSFFEQDLGTQYFIEINRYFSFFYGSQNDPLNLLFVKAGSDLKTADRELVVRMNSPMIFGRKMGMIIFDKTHIALDKFSMRTGKPPKDLISQVTGEVEPSCFGLCDNVDPKHTSDFFDCLGEDYYGVIIANGSYNGNIADLDSTVSRGKRLRNILVEDYQFPSDRFWYFENIGKDSVEFIFDSFLPDRLNGNSKLFIVYIGHGTQNAEMVFKDGRKKLARDFFSRLNDRTGGKQKYPCKEIVFMIDACFSGKMAINRDLGLNPGNSVVTSCDKRSRILLTSSNDTPTTESEFTRALIEGLELNREKYLLLDELIDKIQPEYSRATSGHSQITNSVFDKTEHQDKGSFLFIRKDQFK